MNIVGSPWKCGTCSKVLGITMIEEKMNSVLRRVKSRRDDDNESLLELTLELEQVLHRDHYIIIGIKEIIFQRLSQKIRQQHKVESLDEVYQLRTRMFEDIASVLHKVDSKGTDWLPKLDKIKLEEKKALLL